MKTAPDFLDESEGCCLGRIRGIREMEPTMFINLTLTSPSFAQVSSESTCIGSKKQG